MLIISGIQVIESAHRGGDVSYVRLRVLLDNGKYIDDGVRFLPVGTDLQVFGMAIGQSLLDDAINQEIQQWLSN